MTHPLDKFLFCPVCGSRNWKVHNFKSKQCGDCGFTYYGNPSAANVALICRQPAPGGKGCPELLVVRRKKEPAKGTLDLPGGFTDMGESGEQGVIREVLEETGLHVTRTEYLFSIPNLYRYSGMDIHTLDMFFRCHVEDTSGMQAMDDAEEAWWIPLDELRPEDFGLASIRQGVTWFLASQKKADRE